MDVKTNIISHVFSCSSPLCSQHAVCFPLSSLHCSTDDACRYFAPKCAQPYSFQQHLQLSPNNNTLLLVRHLAPLTLTSWPHTPTVSHTTSSHVHPPTITPLAPIPSSQTTIKWHYYDVPHTSILSPSSTCHMPITGLLVEVSCLSNIPYNGKLRQAWGWNRCTHAGRHM